MKGIFMTAIAMGIVALIGLITMFLVPFLFKYHLNLRITYSATHRQSTLYLISFLNDETNREIVGNYLGGLVSDHKLKNRMQSSFDKWISDKCYEFSVFENGKTKKIIEKQGDCEIKTRIYLYYPLPYSPNEKTKKVYWGFG